ncbi:serine hydrolase domain-containing protein [Bdellovibrionota bacterium FG-2]
MIELSEGTFPRTWEAMRKAVADGVTPGMVAGFWRLKEPDVFRASAVGSRSLVPHMLPMEVDTVFDLASVTKVFATAALATLLVDRRWIRWDTPIQSILPAFRYPQVELRHLLTHTAGFPAWKPFWEELCRKFSPMAIQDVEVSVRQSEMRKLVFAADLEGAPGERTLYSDISHLLLGFVLEEVTGFDFDEAVRRYVWKPMNIESAFFRRVTRMSASQPLKSAAATENSGWRGAILQGLVHDENCWAMGGYSGHAGAFGRAEDLLRFARGWFSGFVSRRTRNEVWSREGSGLNTERTLGWETPSRDGTASASELFSPLSVGHLGFTGTSLWIDPVAELAVVLLTNRVHPTRENIAIRAFRPIFHRSLRQDLKEIR